LTGKSANPPYDPYPNGFDWSKIHHIEAWGEILPNFIFNGQCFSKARYTIGYLGGRRVVGRIGKPVEWLQTPYPPESDTADEFTWDEESTARWRELARKRGASAPDWLFPRPQKPVLRL